MHLNNYRLRQLHRNYSYKQFLNVRNQLLSKPDTNLNHKEIGKDIKNQDTSFFTK
jgi:hypothetical protein